MSKSDTYPGEAPDMALRVETLEYKLMHAEDQLESLNLALYRQQQVIEQLQSQIKDLKAMASSGTPEPRRREDEIPPHY